MERIICSAIWYCDLPLINNDIPNDLLRPINCDSGIVFCGHRHAQCLYQMVAITGLYQYQAGKEVQGFLTSENRFVDRIEGAKIALESKQIEKLNYSNETLYSEDLW